MPIALLCVHIRYFADYNNLESTFLICGILVLQGGIGYAVTEFKYPLYREIMEYVVLLIVVVSTGVCALTVLAELLQSIKFFVKAMQSNRRVKVGCDGDCNGFFFPAVPAAQLCTSTLVRCHGHGHGREHDRCCPKRNAANGESTRCPTHTRANYNSTLPL